MQFGDGSLLSFVVAAAVALLLAAWTWRWRRTLRARLLRRGGSEARDGSAFVQRSRSRSILRVLLVAAALALLGIAVARPQFGDRRTEIRQEGVAVAIVLDVSLSMAAEDQMPNRLAVAQAEIGGLLDRLRGDRVGLVIFAGDAFIRFPLTRDAVAAREIVNALESGEALVSPGTDVAAAIDAARALLATSDAATNVILIVSDGESLQGDALLAAREAADRDLRVFTAGVGTEAGSTIPVADRFSRETTVKLDARTGLPVITRLDAPALASLAEAGRGRFVRLDRPGALSSLAADFAALEASTFAVRSDSTPRERFQIFAAIALALLILEPAIPAVTRRGGAHRRSGAGRGTAFALLLAAVGIIAAACAGAAFQRNEDGNSLLAEGRPRDALDAYRDAQTDAPDDPRLNLNAGQALHALGEFERAVAETSRALDGDGPLLRARAFYHIGNHLLAQGDLVGARNAYIESLLLNPSDIDVKFNLELVNLQVRALSPPPGAGEPGGGPANADDSQTTDGASAAQAQPGDAATAEGETAEGAAGPAGPPGGEQLPGARGGLQDEAGLSAGDNGETAAAALQAALEALDREAPTQEQALAILDALRQRDPRQPFSTGGGGAEAGRDDY